jgi:Uncharacterised nucleotidyltransferase
MLSVPHPVRAFEGNHGGYLAQPSTFGSAQPCGWRGETVVTERAEVSVLGPSNSLLVETTRLASDPVVPRGVLPRDHALHSPLVSNRTREIELLLTCARLNQDVTSQARIKALVEQDLDWNSVIITAHQHRVLPLVWRSLEHIAPDRVPEEAMRRLRNASHGNVRRNLRLTGELVRVLDLLRLHDIPCIPYKGPVLAARIYGDVSLRQFTDLDLIVLPTDVARTRSLLVNHGYEAGAGVNTEKDLTLRRDDLESYLELHWGATTELDPIQIPSEVLWRDLEVFSLAGKSVQTPRYEDLLVILCIHGAKHAWDRLIWLCDVAEIVRSRRLDWNRAIDQATSLGAARMLFLGLTLADQLLGAEPPSDIADRIRKDPAMDTIPGQVAGWLFASSPASRAEREHFFLRLRENSADKVRIALKHAKIFLAPTSRDTEIFPVPKYLSWTLYPLRIVRVGFEYGISPFTRFFRGIFRQ